MLLLQAGETFFASLLICLKEKLLQIVSDTLS